MFCICFYELKKSNKKKKSSNIKLCVLMLLKTEVDDYRDFIFVFRIILYSKEYIYIE